MTLKEMVESAIEAFSPEEHREAFRALIEKSSP